MNRQERRRLRKSRQANGGDAFAALALQQAVECLQGDRPREALKLCRKVLKASPAHADALNLGGVAAFRSDDARLALKLLRAAVAARPDHADAHNNLGNVLKAQGRLDESEAAYRRALEARPGDADAHYNLGIVLEARNRPADAEAAYRHAVESRPGFVDAAINRGNALKALGRVDEAVAVYCEAIVRAPDRADAHNNLGGALRELGRLDAAQAAYRRALDIAPGFAEAHYNLGIVLQDEERFDDAAAAYRRALDAEPDHLGALVNIGYALHRLGRTGDAAAAYRRAIDASPGYVGAHVNLGDLLLDQGELIAALELCDAFLGARPGDTAMLAFKAIVLAELGDREAVRALTGFDRFVRPVRIAAPDGFAGLDAFNAALADHIRGHPTLVFAPASHATRQGRHTGELLVEPKGPVAGLEAAIRQAVEDYAQALPADPAHPFVARRPRRFRLTAWAIVLEGQGYQIPHIHPSAWLSGVYYVALPRVIADGGADKAGWIAFGRPPDHFHTAAEPEVRHVQPEPGLMLLFPSYLYHHTVPHQSAETRISIAFDVLAVDETGGHISG